MMNYAKSIFAVAALGFGITACGNNDVARFPAPPTINGAKAYVQIERLSRPAVKEVFERFVDHQISNAAEPYNDPTLKAAIPAVTQALGRSPQTATFLGAVLYPDQYIVDLAQVGGAAYLGNETGGATSTTKSTFGGRDINDNVIDISLGALFGNTAAKLTVGTPGAVPDDGKENNCLTTQHVAVNARQGKTATFPYLNTPY
ncbi:MAG: hypothetical protein NVS4B5_11020 [Vulcanimicrobiaceae bacterium]